MEYCRGGNLRQFINKYEEEMGEGTFLTLFTQICDGLKVWFLAYSGFAYVLKNI